MHVIWKKVKERKKKMRKKATKSKKVVIVVDDARLVDSILSLRMTHKLHD